MINTISAKLIIIVFIYNNHIYNNSVFFKGPLMYATTILDENFSVASIGAFKLYKRNLKKKYFYLSRKVAILLSGKMIISFCIIFLGYDNQIFKENQ